MSEDQHPFNQRIDLCPESLPRRETCKNHPNGLHSITFYVPSLTSSYVVDYILRRCHCAVRVPCAPFHCITRTQICKYNGQFPTCRDVPRGHLTQSQLTILLEDALFLVTPTTTPVHSSPDNYKPETFTLSVPVQYQRHDQKAIDNLAETIQIFASLKLPRYNAKRSIGPFILRQCQTARGGVSLLTSRSLLLRAMPHSTVKYSVQLSLTPNGTADFATCSYHALHPKVCTVCYTQSVQLNNPRCANHDCPSYLYPPPWNGGKSMATRHQANFLNPPPSSPPHPNAPQRTPTHLC